MGSLFGGDQPEKLFGVKVNNSELGHPLTVVMGCAKTNQLIFWIDGFSSQALGKKSGGGKGGGKGGQDIYFADVVAGLSAGPINGIGDVWTGQSWLGSPKAYESYTIATPYTYTPTNAAALVNDYGVLPSDSYTATTSDYGAPTSTSLSSNSATPYVQVAYGTTPASGQYTVNPSTGQYTFSAANAGKTVTVAYSYNLTIIDQQESDIVPSSGRQIHVGGTFQFQSDLGVVYGGTGSNTGVALTKVNGTPSVAGTYSVSGSGPATYSFATGDVGAEVVITYQIQNLSAVGQGQSDLLDFTLSDGYIGQSPYSFLSSSFPGAALGYSGIANLLYQPMILGEAGELQENSFEVITKDGFGGGIVDCNPITCITRVLTDTQWGLGGGPVPFPASFIDSVSWGARGTSGAQQTGATAWNWFTANNFFISPILDSQDSAASVISKWLEAGVTAAYVSEGLLKLVPYGDTSQSANGCTWTAPTTFIVALDDTCFLAKEGDDPVKISRAAWQDAYNDVQVQWNNRANQYSQEITEESDQSCISRFGSRIEDPQDWGFITTLSAATFAANMRLKRGTQILNTYEFSLPFTYSYLEPMDIVTISTTSVWDGNLNNTLGISGLPVRISKIVDDPVDGLKITCEDYPYGSGQPVVYYKGLNTSNPVINTYAYPGNSDAVVFEASGRATNYLGNQLWIGACGTGSDWGSTNVWVSQDNTNYILAGTISTPSVIGTTTTSFPSTADPDTTTSLSVQVAQKSPALVSGTTTAADNDSMLCYVNGELISYSACALTGQSTYTMSSYIRRGQLGTAIGSHAIGSLFMRIDNSLLRYTYDPVWQGKTIYLKFQSVNQFGENAQPLSSLTATTFTLAAINTGVTVGVSSGLNSQGSIIPAENVILSSAFTSSSVTLSWTAQSMLRADGTSLSIPSGSQSWTGLSNATSYYLYPSINATTGIVTFFNPTPPTTSPSSTYAIQTGGDGYVALPVFVVTTSSTGGTGGGSTGGGSVCGEAAELVDIQGKGNVALGTVMAGDYVRGKCLASGADVFRRVTRVEHLPSVAWRMVDGHRVSPCEPVHINGEWMPAYRAPGATVDTYSGIKVHLTVDTGDYNESNYYLTGGVDLLIHNYAVSPC